MSAFKPYLNEDLTNCITMIYKYILWRNSKNGIHQNQGRE